eukprot:TRINITY_DN10413_c0_g3_i4.p1 TRINITY_DN10413_c0_g3~~TRINITY_DN10413_c0_g3_i4.p1  ORF type:complete len:126 (+),score=3.02 TRINITY_DN10413_c0_g3_i4:137-514(+)
MVVGWEEGLKWIVFKKIVIFEWVRLRLAVPSGPGLSCLAGRWVQPTILAGHAKRAEDPRPSMARVTSSAPWAMLLTGPGHGPLTWLGPFDIPSLSGCVKYSGSHINNSFKSSHIYIYIYPVGSPA